MLPLLAVYLILCLDSMSGEVWAEKLPPNTRNGFVVDSFLLEIFPIVSCPFRENPYVVPEKLTPPPYS